MKNLFILFLFAGLEASAQDLKEFSVLAFLGSGVSAELGKSATENKLGYHFGTAFEFGPNASKDMDLSFYAKGELWLMKYLSATALVGVRDFYAVTYGMGLRGLIPTNGPTIIIEPTWRNDNQSVLAVGLKWKL